MGKRAATTLGADGQQSHRWPPRGLLRTLGPGLITGAADDDPSGIATYSQAGAQFGYSLGWLMIISYPMMVIVQGISAGIGAVTGAGIAENLRRQVSASRPIADIPKRCRRAHYSPVCA